MSNDPDNPISDQAKYSELQRELAMRRSVYPRMVAGRRLVSGAPIEEQQKTASYRIRVLEAIVDDYAERAKAERERDAPSLPLGDEPDTTTLMRG